MKIRDEARWRSYLEHNTDPYGKYIVVLAERWADLMEVEIANGRTVAQVADKTFSRADTEGATGFMYGAAVSTLSDVWEHGEELRRWHNPYEPEHDDTFKYDPVTMRVVSLEPSEKTTRDPDQE